MKKYLILSFLFLLVVSPVVAKGAPATSGQQTNSNSGSVTTTVSPTNKPIVSPTGNQVKNKNEVQTKNQGEEKQLEVKTQESEQLNQTVGDSFTKVSDQVHQLIDTVGAKGGIGQQVKEIAQSQTKIQDEIKSSFSQLNSRSSVAKLFLGSDKKTIKTMTQQMEQNRLMIQQLEELKLQTKNTADLQQLQETIDLMTYQNTSLKEVIDKETKINGMFGWLLNLFNK